MAEFAAQAPRAPAGEASLVNFSFRIPAIAPLLLAGLAVRLALAFFPGFGVDMGTFRAWGNDLATHGPGDFYREGFFADYAPGYLYVLWFFGELNQQFHFSDDQYEYILKFPSIAADLGSAYLIYLILAGQNMRVRMGAVAIYLFFPAALIIGAVWGQVDSILAFFLLLSVYFIGRGKPVHGAVAYTVGFIVKIQAIAALPFLIFWIIREHPPNFWPFRSKPDPNEPPVSSTLVLCATVPLLVLLVIITPFFELEPWRLLEVMEHATKTPNYRVNSFFAYNFWTIGGLFEWGFRCDGSQCPPVAEGVEDRSTYFLGIATRWWGMGGFLVALVLILYTLRNARGTGWLALGTALSVLAFYLFMTRMHERYAFPAFLPLLVAVAFVNNRYLWAAFAVTSAIHFFNLYHVYAYYNPNELMWKRGYDWLAHSDFLGTGFETVQVLSVVFVASFIAMLVTAFTLLRDPRREDSHL